VNDSQTNCFASVGNGKCARSLVLLLLDVRAYVYIVACTGVREGDSFRWRQSDCHLDSIKRLHWASCREL